MGTDNRVVNTWSTVIGGLSCKSITTTVDGKTGKSYAAAAEIA